MLITWFCRIVRTMHRECWSCYRRYDGDRRCLYGDEVGGPLRSGITDALELHGPNGHVNGGRSWYRSLDGKRKCKNLGLVLELRKRAEESKART